MKKFLQKITILCALGIATISFAQVGIRVDIPTETLDVKGTTRIQTLPNENEPINTTETGSAGASTFTPKSFVVADGNGVLGKSTKEDSTNPSDLNNSKSILVIQRIHLKDWPSKKNGNKGYDTGMSTDKWEAMLSAPKLDLMSEGREKNNEALNNPWGFEMGKATIGAEKTWVILGNIKEKSERGYVDVLFIKKEFVSVTPNRIDDNQ